MNTNKLMLSFIVTAAMASGSTITSVSSPASSVSCQCGHAELSEGLRWGTADASENPLGFAMYLFSNSQQISSNAIVSVDGSMIATGDLVGYNLVYSAPQEFSPLFQLNVTVDKPRYTGDATLSGIYSPAWMVHPGDVVNFHIDVRGHASDESLRMSLSMFDPELVSNPEPAPVVLAMGGLVGLWLRNRHHHSL